MSDRIARRRRWFQYSLRTLIVFVTVCAVACSIFAVRLRTAREQRDAVYALRHPNLPFYTPAERVFYDYEVDESGELVSGKDPPVPAWLPASLKDFLGVDYFSDVVVAIPETDTEMARVPALPRLKKLLCGLAVTDAGLSRLLDATRQSRLAKLEILDLSESRLITDAGFAVVASLSGLRRLELGDSRVGDTGLESIRGLRNLEELNLMDTHVTDKGLLNIRELGSLKELNLNHTDVTNAGLVNLAGLHHLKRLFLDCPGVGNEGLAYIKGLSELERLDLEEAHITDAGLEHLAHFRALRELHIGDAVTAAGVKTLRAAMPECWITAVINGKPESYQPLGGSTSP